MIFSSPHIIQLLITYKYFILLPLAIIDPSITPIIAGFLSSLNYLNVFLVYLVVVIGDTGGDGLYYAFGRYGRLRFVKKFGPYIGLSVTRITHLEKHFKHHLGKSLILGKYAHGLGPLILIATGVAKIPYKRLIWFNFLATLPKSLILVLVGFYLGSAYTKIKTYFDYTALATITLSVVLILTYIMITRASKKYEKKY